MKALLAWNPTDEGECNTANGVIGFVNRTSGLMILTSDLELAQAKGAVEIDGFDSQEQCNNIVETVVADVSLVRLAKYVTLTTNYSAG